MNSFQNVFSACVISVQIAKNKPDQTVIASLGFEQASTPILNLTAPLS